MVEPLKWEDGAVRILDQTELPGRVVYRTCRDVGSMAEAISSLRIRGAPLIGIAAAYGVVLGVWGAEDEGELWRRLEAASERIASTRPTAVNLFWALERMRRAAEAHRGEGSDVIREALLHEASEIHREDRDRCRAIGKHGAELLPERTSVLTHCNAGALATGGIGTALAVLYVAWERSKEVRVFVDETRPLLQGARLTAWELQQAGMDVTLICDDMAGWVMSRGWVDAVVVGADRIAANGDFANKIGTYSLAVLARHHRVPFYVAAPLSTWDFSITDGSQIPIEERGPEEVTQGFGRNTAPEGVRVYNPAFDVTPAELVTAFISEKGVALPPFGEHFRRWSCGAYTSPNRGRSVRKYRTKRKLFGTQRCGLSRNGL
ncbi:MAG TPA: S-methyl-5-thioribose-1-phosphate isomerase [Candidatus Latescibacteria bacterium]|nr:S-methyl-5-thioribose-1-phosphate isomerase [Candidatus Latescibacterota bacterium]